MKILKLHPKASLLLKRQGQHLFASGAISKQFQMLWEKFFDDYKIKEKDDLVEALTKHIPQISKILSEVEISGSIAINIESPQGTFDLIFYLVEGDSFLFTLEDKSGTARFQKRIHLHHEAIKLIDHAHPGALFQVKRDRGNLLTMEFASPRLSEVIGIENTTVDDFLMLLETQTKKRLIETFRACQDDLIFSGEISNPKRYWQIRASILKQEDGETIFLGVLENITEKKEQFEQLEYTSNFLSSITENIPIGIAICNINTKSYLYVNAELCRITGFKEKEFLNGGFGFTKNNLIVEGREFFIHQFSKPKEDILKNFKEKNDLIQGNIKIQNKSGEIRTLSTTFRPLGDISNSDYDGNFIFMTEDITEKVNLENHRRRDEMLLIQSNKMAELGELASCIAHEINNPLSILTHLLEDLAESHKNEKISTAFQTLERITRIVKILTTFGRDTGQEGPGEAPITLEKILSDTLPLCQHKLTNKGIDLKVSGNLEKSPFINDTLLSQVFLNLINNSYDEIESLNDKRWIAIESKVINSRINIIFSDSGIAPNLESMQLWFEPFHTTKVKGKGTGLGLAICQNLLRAAGGEIRPIAAKNTSFLISLPLWPKIEDKT